MDKNHSPISILGEGGKASAIKIRRKFHSPSADRMADDRDRLLAMFSSQSPPMANV